MPPSENRPSLEIISIRLRVSDLARSADFYTRQLGFAIVTETGVETSVAVAPGTAPILTLMAAPDAPSPAREAAGLFHAALVFPSRPALGAWLKFAAAREVEFDGFSDHGVSEAIYFSDPDGNGLEFYVDRPRAKWPYRADGELAMITSSLDVRGLVDNAAPDSASPLAGCRWGHLHLRVTDLARSEAFYRQQLGVEVTQRTYPGARFLAADGYHHHLGLNTWGNPRLPQAPGALGLAESTFATALISASVDTVLADPDGISLRLVPLAIAAP